MMKISLVVTSTCTSTLKKRLSIYFIQLYCSFVFLLVNKKRIFDVACLLVILELFPLDPSMTLSSKGVKKTSLLIFHRLFLNEFNEFDQIDRQTF